MFNWVMLMVLGLWLQACSSVEKKADTPSEQLKLAEYYQNEERYEEALRRYNQIRQKFPFSAEAIEADLRVADVYFLQEAFPEAQMAYEFFREQRPQHPRSDYVLFRIGLSYFKQLPDTYERDLSVAPKAIEAFQDLLAVFPQSTFREEAMSKKEEAIQLLRVKEQSIGDFYYKKQQFASALERYEDLLKQNLTETMLKQVLKKAIRSAQKMGDIERAKALMARAQRQFKDSSLGGEDDHEQ